MSPLKTPSFIAQYANVSTNVRIASPITLCPDSPFDVDESSEAIAQQIEQEQADRLRFNQITDHIRRALPDRIMMVLMTSWQRNKTPFFYQFLGNKMIALSTTRGIAEIQFIADPYRQSWHCTTAFSDYLQILLSKEDADFVSENTTPDWTDETKVAASK